MKIGIVYCFLVLFTSTFFCQSYSQDYNPDARATSLGESLVASQSGIPSAENNPASIAFYNKTTLLYSNRDFKYGKGSKNYLYSTGVIFPTSIGCFEFLYKHYRSNDLTFYIIGQPEIASTEIYDHTFNLSYARDISEDLSAGITLKACNVVSSESKYLESNTSVLIDLGILFKTDGFIKNDANNEKLYFGAAIQNFGSKLREKFTTSISPLYSYDYSYNIPRYIKLGFSYEFDINDNSSRVVKTIITGEYKNKFTNTTYYYNNYPVEFFGLGTEFIFYDIFAFRLGGIFNSHDNSFGAKGKFPVRVGGSLNLPFDSFINNFPFSFSFDFSSVPIYGGFYIYSKSISTNLWTFNLNLTYNTSLF